MPSIMRRSCVVPHDAVPTPCHDCDLRASLQVAVRLLRITRGDRHAYHGRVGVMSRGLSCVCTIACAACGRIGFVENQPGDGQVGDGQPNATPIGCADGTREGYSDVATYPTIAGCGASWVGELDLRATATGAACGNDLGMCVSPADACARGWHVCASSGDVTELLVLTATTCANEVGSFVAAAGHCVPGPGCSYPAPGQFACVSGVTAPCTQPICCGTLCNRFNGCRDGVWPSATSENASGAPGCANTSSMTQTGVLCCR
jgi:hypothetical protein